MFIQSWGQACAAAARTASGTQTRSHSPQAPAPGYLVTLAVPDRRLAQAAAGATTRPERESTALPFMPVTRDASGLCLYQPDSFWRWSSVPPGFEDDPGVIWGDWGSSWLGL